MKPVERQAPYFSEQESCEEVTFANLKMYCHQLKNLLHSSVSYCTCCFSSCIMLFVGISSWVTNKTACLLTLQGRAKKNN